MQISIFQNSLKNKKEYKLAEKKNWYSYGKAIYKQDATQ